MKITLLLLTILTLFTFSCLAQEKVAKKLSDFGEISCDKMTGKVDDVISALTSEPNSKAYIIYYSGFYFVTQKTKKGTWRILVDHRPFSFAKAISRQFGYRKIEEAKFELKYGGYQDKVLFDVWLVPEGAEPPLPNPTVNPKDEKFKNIKVIKRSIPCLW